MSPDTEVIYISAEITEQRVVKTVYVIAVTMEVACKAVGGVADWGPSGEPLGTVMFVCRMNSRF